MELIYGNSQKSDGPMELKKPGGKNRLGFYKRAKISPLRCVVSGLVHGNKVKKAGSFNIYKVVKDADALITDLPNIFLTITVADCFPVFFYDKRKAHIGLAHCGWRGTIKNLAGKTALKMLQNFKLNTKNICVKIGPGIQKCHFEIKKDILPEFKNYRSAITIKNGKVFANLPKIIKTQLISLGIKGENIKISGECTFCLKHKYYSFRRDKPKKLFAMVAFIGLLPKV